jgi:hypothetical protein
MAKRQDILNTTSGAEGRESLGFREEGEGRRRKAIDLASSWDISNSLAVMATAML